MKLLKCVFHWDWCFESQSEHVLACHTLALHLITLLCLCVNFWLKTLSVVPHPPFWVDLVPYYFTLFSDLNIVIREGDWMMLSWFWQNHGMHFRNLKPYLLKCSEWWHSCWVCYIKPQGDYSEGDSIDQEVNVVMEIEIQSGNCVITSHKLFLCCCEYGYRITVEVLSLRFVWMTFLSQTWGKQILLKLRYLLYILYGITVEDYGLYTSGLTHTFFFFSCSRCESDSNELHGWLKYRHNFKIILTLRLLMSYICGAPIPDVSRSHTTTQHSR